MPGSTPPTSQLDWLSSTTAMIVLLWSRATRDLLKSFGWGIAALHRLDCSDEVAISRRPPHSIFWLTGFGSKASSLVCRLDSLRIPLKPRTLRDHNGIEEGGTRREARLIRLWSHVSASSFVAPSRFVACKAGDIRAEGAVQLEFFSFSCAANHSIEPGAGLGVAGCGLGCCLARVFSARWRASS